MRVMLAVFHCLGTVDELSERLKICETGAAKKGAPSFRNQLGRSSGPGAVGLILSRVLKTSNSDNQVDGSRHDKGWIDIKQFVCPLHSMSNHQRYYTDERLVLSVTPHCMYNNYNNYINS